MRQAVPFLREPERRSLEGLSMTGEEWGKMRSIRD